MLSSSSWREKNNLRDEKGRKMKRSRKQKGKTFPNQVFNDYFIAYLYYFTFLFGVPFLQIRKVSLN